MKTLEQMAEEAGFDVLRDGRIFCLGEGATMRLHHLAALVAERCAQIAEGYDYGGDAIARQCREEFPKP